MCHRDQVVASMHRIVSDAKKFWSSMQGDNACLACPNVQVAPTPHNHGYHHHIIAVSTTKSL